MPLDPLVKAFLDKAAAIPRPKAWDVPPAMARQSFAGMMQLTGPKDVPVGKIDNFTIPGPGGENPRPRLCAHCRGRAAAGADLFSWRRLCRWRA